MIKLICFDYDGTLADMCLAHKISLNKAIESVAGEEFIISDEEHNNIYNGLSTKTKLKLLAQNKNLPTNLINQISIEKQKHTIEYIENNIGFNEKLFNDLTKLKNEGFELYCCSNAIYETVELGLKKLGVFDLFNKIYGNEAVKRQKPAPDIYLQAMLDAGVDPTEVLIIEDSEFGIMAANDSKAYVLKVSPDTKETTYKNIKIKIEGVYDKQKTNN